MEWMGGGERTALIMALDLGADFITAYASPSTYPDYQRELGSRLRLLTRNVIHKEVIRYFWMRYIFWKNRKIFRDYDTLIASGQAATEVVAHFSRPDAKRIVYTHTPPRRIYDLYELSRLNYKWFLRPLFTLFTKYWEWQYLRAIDKFDYNIANSENIKERFNRYTGRTVDEVIWPPIITDRFHWISDGDYFLSWARVDEHKRVDLVVRAFCAMPDQKLVVASGGSSLEAVKALAAGHDNIRFVGWQEDDALAELVGNCQAAVYIPINEDAGMTQLEANAAGKPVLGVDEGGLKETIIEGETGFKIKSNPEIEDIISAVRKMTPEWCQSKKDACIVHAQKYDRKIFAEKIKMAVENIG